MNHRILSIDGGGSRAIIAAEALASLQYELPRPLISYFDLVTGTSAGAIMALALASGRIEATQLPKFFEELSPKIFKRRKLRNGIFRPKYSSKRIDRELRRVFSASSLSEMKVDTMVTAYSVTRNESVFFKSWKHSQRNVYAWEAARASSAAPTYFPAHKMIFKGSNHSMVDGALAENNPSMCATSELLRRGVRGEDIHVVSFGTGEQVSPLSHKQASKFGIAQYAKPLLPLLFDGGIDTVDYICSSIVGSYDRFQVKGLPKELRKMDHSNPRDLRVLTTYAHRFDPALKRLARKLS